MITEGHLVRHFQGRHGGRGPAIIDVAQDHVLHLLAQQGAFDLGIALKGGTAIRKFHAGSAGRFSTDLDFAGVDDAVAELLVELIDGTAVGQFTFALEPIDGTQRMRLAIASAFGESDILARLDLGRRPLWIPPQVMTAVPLPIHARYEFECPRVPVSSVEEILAEKLARFRRVSLARDLYDLAWLGSRAFDESLVRRLVILKVWIDVNDDGLGQRPFQPDDILGDRAVDAFEPEAIGYLTTPVGISAWLRTIRERFEFLNDLDDTERRIARCSGSDTGEVRRLISALGDPRG